MMTRSPATLDTVLSPAPLRRLQFTIALAVSTVANASAGEAPLLAVKMLNPPAAPLESAVAELKTAGVRAVYCRVDNLLATPTTSAHVRNFRQLLADSNITFHITAPVFLDTAALARDPALAGIGHLGNPSREPGVAWLGFVCPARPDYRQQRQAQILNQVRELRPDGLSLDFVRYFIYWERAKPDQSAEEIEKFCFCDHCLHEMETTLGFQFPADASNRTARSR
jgi:hypothetical protein